VVLQADNRECSEGIREPLIQLSNPDVSKADRFTGIGMGLQFDGDGIEQLEYALGYSQQEIRVKCCEAGKANGEPG
jgi:hypothetical protein